MLRIQLVSNKLGTLTIDKNDPLDIQNLVINVKRSDKKQGIVYTVLLNVQFIEEARDFLQSAFETDGGIDSVVAVNLYEYDDFKRQFVLRFEGTCNFESYDLGEIDLSVNIDQQNFQMLVDTFGDIDVDLATIESQSGLTIPAQNFKDITLHSKTIVKQDKTFPDTFLDFLQPGVYTFDIPNGFPGASDVSRENIAYLEISNSGQTDDNTSTDHPLSFAAINGKELFEVDDTFQQPFQFVAFDDRLDNNFTVGTVPQYQTFFNAHKDTRFPKIEFQNAGLTDVSLKLKLQFELLVLSGNNSGIKTMQNVEVFAWFEWRDKNDVAKEITQIGQWVMPGGNPDPTEPPSLYLHKVSNVAEFTFTSNDKNVVAGDKMYVYATMRQYGQYDRPTSFSDAHYVYDHRVTAFDGTYINITQRSTAPSSTGRMVMLHEAFQKCLQYITGQTDCFRSSLLGRTDLGYDADGKYSLIAYSNGNNLRNKRQTDGSPYPMFANLNELYNFVNMLTPVGMGFEKDDNGQQVVVLEPIEYFYDKTVTTIDLGPVEDARKKLNKDRYFNQIEIGYTTKMDVGELNAIDEFNTLRRFKIPIANSKNKLTVTTPLVASGYIIETQRRFASSTKDSKYDDNKFVVSVIRDGGNFKSRKNEGYSQILNVFDPSTVYNIDITPAQCLQNWFSYIASNLIYAIVPKIVSFTYGEFNFTLVTKKTGATNSIAENGDFDISSSLALWDNLDYDVAAPLTMEQLKLIQDNPNAMIQFEDAYGNVLRGFISTQGIQYKTDDMTELSLMKAPL